MQKHFMLCPSQSSGVPVYLTSKEWNNHRYSESQWDLKSHCPNAWANPPCTWVYMFQHMTMLVSFWANHSNIMLGMFVMVSFSTISTFTAHQLLECDLHHKLHTIQIKYYSILHNTWYLFATVGLEEKIHSNIIFMSNSMSTFCY